MSTSAHGGSYEFSEDYRKKVHSARADVGIGPYNAYKNSVGFFELLQFSRERSKKTEAVFLVASWGRPGEIEIPPARFLFPAFPFGEAKENAVLQLLISNKSLCLAACKVGCLCKGDAETSFLICTTAIV